MLYSLTCALRNATTDIDFGHFLGNFKYKFGIRRERAAFVFTPEMAYVMGGDEYKKHPLYQNFKQLCYDSFNSLRKHSRLFIALFILVSWDADLVGVCVWVCMCACG